MFLFKRHGVFYLQYLDETENRIRRLSTKCTREREALNFLTRFKEKLNAAEPRIRSISILDFLNEYVAFLQSGHSPDYIRSIRTSFRMLTRFLTKNNSNDFTRLQALTPATVELFFNEKFKESPSAASLYYRTLKAAFTKAVEWSYLSESPVRKIKLPKVVKNLPAFITESQLESICTNAETPQLANLCHFAFYTGMRLSEILNLEWNSINMADRIIKVANTDTFTTKSKAERIIPINEKLNQILRRIQPEVLTTEKDYVFPKRPGLPYDKYRVSHEFKEAARKAGIENVHFHVLRHSFASNLIRRGVPIVNVKELLGHAHISTTEIYSHVGRADLVNAVKVLEQD